MAAQPLPAVVEPTPVDPQSDPAQSTPVAAEAAAVEPTVLPQPTAAAQVTPPTQPSPLAQETGAAGPTPAATAVQPGAAAGLDESAALSPQASGFAVPAAPAPAQAAAAADQGASLPSAPDVEPPVVDQSPAGLEPSAGATSPAAKGLSLLELAAAQRQERLQQLTAAPAIPPSESPPVAAAPVAPEQAESEPQLGEFDDTFTWSAEVLAAQGRQVEDMSVEEIDWLGRLRRGLEKTRRGFVTQLLENLGDDPLTPEVLDDLETTLLRADVGVQATDRVLEALRRRLNQEVVDPAEGLRFLKEQLRGLLEEPIKASAAELLAPQKDRLNIWLMVGVNGVGKTTTLGKLANLAVRSGYSCLIAAADTFRAAAVEQVSIWGQRSGVPVIANPSANADPAAVVYDAIGAARAKGTELVLVDTAGRLQTKHNLMEELTKVRRIIDKLAPEAVVESLLVLDASQGQNGLRQAMAFASAAGLTGVVITKLDGSARGGVALAVASEARLPIRFIGAGEGIRDLRPFNSFEFVEALLSR
ncbi:MAG: signal recognition particle-docking protein FtsY [Synechococcaceae cyanobacterium ELA739]